MGLLEKADQLKTGEVAPVTPPEARLDDKAIVGTQATSETADAVSPEPVNVKAKKSRRGRRKRREKKTRTLKTLPEEFEEASNGQKLVRRGADFTVSWGWSVPLLIITAWGTSVDPTYLVVLGLMLMIFNLGFMPRSTGRTVGNWISRTTYVNSKGSTPHPAYPLIKGTTFAVVLVGVVMVATSIQDIDKTSGQVLFGVGFVILIPPILDYLFVRFKRDNMGMWDVLFGGVWLVRTAKTAEAKGWLKRLEQLGDYSAERGWLQDSGSGEGSTTDSSD